MGHFIEDWGCQHSFLNNILIEESASSVHLLILQDKQITSESLETDYQGRNLKAEALEPRSWTHSEGYLGVAWIWGLDLLLANDL